MFSILNNFQFTLKANKKARCYLDFFNTFAIKNLSSKDANNKNRLNMFRMRHKLSINLSYAKNIHNIDFVDETALTQSKVWSLSEVITNVPILASEYISSLDSLLRETISNIAKDHKTLECIGSAEIGHLHPNLRDKPTAKIYLCLSNQKSILQ